MPVDITDPAGGASRKVQAFPVTRPAAEDTVGDARARVWGRYDAREGHAVPRDNEDGQEVGMADEEVAFGVDGEAVGAGVAERLDCGSAWRIKGIHRVRSDMDGGEDTRLQGDVRGTVAD